MVHVAPVKHLETHGLMDGAPRGARSGCSGTIDNLLIDRTVTLYCHRRKHNLRMAWIDVKKACGYGRPWLVGGDDDSA